MQTMYRIAGIDVHKKMLAVVVADVVAEGEWEFERRWFGTLEDGLEALRAWIGALGVREAVMESTALYWMPVWRSLEGACLLHLAHAQSNRAPQGRKRDFADAERLVRRHAAGELLLSFVPGPEQRLWRAATRGRYQLTCERVRLQNQLEALLEDARLKLSSCVSDLLGLSSRRMLEALAAGTAEPEALAALAAPGLRASREQLCQALRHAPVLAPLHRQLLALLLERLRLIEQQREALDQSIAQLLQAHGEAVARLTEIPGIAVNAAQQIVAEVGPQAASFASPARLASWAGLCPGRHESAGVSASNRCPRGNRTLRRVLTEAAHGAARTRGCRYQALYRHWVVRLGPARALWAVAHRLCRLVWRVLHEGDRYQERGPEPDAKAARQRAARLVRRLRALGYQVEISLPPPLPA
ncbi:MAG TPA: IS110 family transposase [Ktedonobacterales bacterium]|nr:IS110 family transposase [Ktedonobacterales bacterium]